MGDQKFRKFKSSINRGITTLSLKTSSTLEKSKTKTHIESLCRDIEKELMSVGERAYEIWEKQSDDFSALTEHFEIIKNKHEEVEHLSALLALIDERDKQILGYSAEEPERVSAKMISCPNCGAQYETLTNFCRKCGNRL